MRINCVNRLCGAALWTALVVGGIACGGAGDTDAEQTGSVVGIAHALNATEAVDISDQKDSSASPVHVQVKTCTTTDALVSHLVECEVDPEYALVGGGAEPDGPALLTESRPLTGRAWRASSVRHLTRVSHRLKVYAIGLRLDGVNTQALRNAIRWKEVHQSGSVARAQIDNGYVLLGGGAQTIANDSDGGYSRFLTSVYPSAYHEWTAGSTDHYDPVDGTTSAWLLELKDEMIEGFGRLEIRLLSNNRHVTDGFSTASVPIETGWALIGMGGRVERDANQPARMLVSIRPGDDIRSVNATSRDQVTASAGTTYAYALMARKKPSTHGLCNPGAALDRSADGCVTRICSTRAQCCTAGWDATCVGMVESVCGRSCAEHTCVKTDFEPSKWVRDDGRAVGSNCYSYALNRYPTGLTTQDPGESLQVPRDYVSDSNIVRLATGDGLIPSTFSATCSDNRTKVFLRAHGGMFDYHWWRQDRNGQWSDKFGTFGTPTVSVDDGDRPHQDVPGGPVEQYFCACDHALPSELPAP